MISLNCLILLCIFIVDLFYLFSFTVCAWSMDILQPIPVMVVQLGSSVTLTCLFSPNVNLVAWYKQTIGQKPVHMVSSYHSNPQRFYSDNFAKDFTETERLSVTGGVHINNLTISKTQPEDAATYYCVATIMNTFTFAEGTVLRLKGTVTKLFIFYLDYSGTVHDGIYCFRKQRT